MRNKLLTWILTAAMIAGSIMPAQTAVAAGTDYNGKDTELSEDITGSETTGEQEDEITEPGVGKEDAEDVTEPKNGADDEAGEGSGTSDDKTISDDEDGSEADDESETGDEDAAVDASSEASSEEDIIIEEDEKLAKDMPIELYINDSKSGAETVTVDSEHYYGDGWFYDIYNNTLTLYGFDGSFIEATGELTIYLKGNNKLTLPEEPTDNYLYGIKMPNNGGQPGALTIDADDDATLTLGCNTMVSGKTYDLLYARATFNNGKLIFDANCPYSIVSGAGKTTFKGTSSFEGTIVSEESGSVFNSLVYESSAASSITLKGGTKALGGLKATGSGSLTVTTSESVPSLCGRIEISEDAGDVTLNGPVIAYRSSNITSDLNIAGNKAVSNHLTQGYKWNKEDYYNYTLTTLDGTTITDAKFTTSNEPLTVMGTEFALGALKVDEYFYSEYEVNLYLNTIGGSGGYQYRLKEGSSLPAGLSVDLNEGIIKGTPTQTSATGGTATIVISDSAGATTEVSVSYGAVIEIDRFINIDGQAIKTSVNSKDDVAGWSYTSSTNTITLNGYNGGPITTDDINSLNIYLKGNNSITVPGDSTDSEPCGIRMPNESGTYKDLTIDADTGATLTITCDTSQNKNYSLIAATTTVNGGKLILTGKNTAGGIFAAGGTIFNEGSSFEVDIQMEGSLGAAFGKLDYRSSKDSTIKTSGGSRAVYSLYATGSGELTINNADGNGECITGKLVVGENAGKITLNGTVSCRVDSGSLSDNAKLAANKAVTNHISTGYTWQREDYYIYSLTDLTGTKITNAVIDTVTDQPLTVMQDEFNISGMAVDQNYDTTYTMYLFPYTVGGAGEYSYALKEGSSLPAGLNVHASLGYIFGKPTEVSEGGSAIIVVTDKAGATKEVTVNYGAVDASSPVSSVAIAMDSYTFGVGEEATVTATVLPADASVTDVRFSVTDEPIAQVKQNSVVHADNVTTAKIQGLSVGKTKVNVATLQGGKTANCDITVREATPDAECTVDITGIILNNLLAGRTYQISIKGVSGTENRVATYGYIALADSFIGSDAYMGHTLQIVLVNEEDEDLNSAPQELTIAVEKPTEIPIVVKVPKTGETPEDEYWVTNNSPYSTFYYVDTARFTPTDTTFEKGKAYTFNVTLKARGNLRFDAGTKLRLNGELLDVAGTLAYEGKELSFSYTFPATSDVVQVEKVSLDSDEYLIYDDVPDKAFTVSIMPINADDQTYTADTADHNVAVVENNNTLKPVGAGKTTLTVTTTDGGKTATADVYVRYKTPFIKWNGKTKLIGFAPGGKYLITKEGEDPVEPVIDSEGKVEILDEWYNSTLSIIRVHALEKCTSDAIEINVGSKYDGKGEGMVAEFADGDEYTYTGSKITPKVLVYNDDELLTEGKDYTVKYSGNVNVVRDKSGTSIPGAKATVTGKGNLAGSKVLTFTIVPKSLGDGTTTPAEGIQTGTINIAKGQKATAPVITYGSYQLATKDYKITDPMNGKKFTEATSTTYEVEGKGNFKGSVKLNLYVAENKKSLKKYVITVDTKKTITYDPQKSESDMKTEFAGLIKVYDSADKQKTLPLTEGHDYVITYPSNLTDAGKKNLTIIGIGSYSGSAKKTVTVKPLVVKPANNNGSVTNNHDDVSGNTYYFVQGGVTPGDDIIVKYVAPDEHEEQLTEGVDYKVSYSNNKAVSKAGKPAEYSITFIGNYKGTPAIKNTKAAKNNVFTILPTAIGNAHYEPGDGIEVVVPDVAYTGKAGTYYSTPVVTLDDVTLAKSNYTVKYFMKDEHGDFTSQITSKNKLSLSPEEYSKEVQVLIEAKGNVAGKGNYSGTVRKTYNVIRVKADEVFDLSKCRITLYGKDYNPANKKNAKLSGIPYNGNPRTLDDLDTDGKKFGTVVVEYKIGKNYVPLKEGDDYELTYMNNVNKGKAILIVSGTNFAHDGKKFVGSKQTTFKITAFSVKAFLKILGLD